MSKDNALISVIVPIYMIERYLGICIESIINQTYKNLEIILVDDGSPDRCPEICDLYAKKDKRIKVVHKENGGLVSARKAGFLASTGAYIGYVDGDDWIDSNFFEDLYSNMVLNEADIVIAGQSRDIFGKCEHILNHIPVGIYENKQLEYIYSNMISYGEFYRQGITTYVWNKLFKREVLTEAQLNVDERITIGEDAAVTYPAILLSKKISITNNCSYHYRQREDSMLKEKASLCDEALKLKYLYDYLFRFVKKYSSQFRLNEQIIDFIASICIIRSGGSSVFTKNNNEIININVENCKKKVVIFSAGTFGQQLMNRLKELKQYEVVGWLDDDYWEYRRCCMDVDPVENIMEMEFDFIFIATVDCVIADKIEKRLLNYGVPVKKILKVLCAVDERKALVDRFININLS